MKKLIFTSLILVSLLSCTFNMKSVITGDGDVVTDIREIENFRHLKASMGLDVIITFGSELSLKVEADKNLIEVIKTELEDGVLKVYAEATIRRAKKKNIYITVPELKSIGVSSAAYVRSENLLKTADIEIGSSSAGEIELQVEAKNISIDISSSGKAILNGITEDINVDVSSAGDLRAFDLISQTCKVSVSSAGHASVNVVRRLIAEASSAGSIEYRRNPEDKKIDKSSAGSVVQK